MLGGDRELGQHFKQDGNAEDGGGDLGEPTANLHRCHPMLARALLVHIWQSPSQALWVTLCPRFSFLSLLFLI